MKKTATSQRSVYDLTRENLEEQMSEWKEPHYRVSQIWNGLYQNLWGDIEDFKTLPGALRDNIASAYRLQSLTPYSSLQSSDGFTEKTLFKLHDQYAIETVLMRYDDRNTLCISTQAGCAMGCVFCATGQMGFQRNLTCGEIVEQVVYYARKLREMNMHPTNIVVMGMGEPFHNYEPTIEAVLRINDEKGLNIGARKITISTVGLIPGIRRFMNDSRLKQINLAISLHASNDLLRSSMLPINNKYPLRDLIDVCKEYTQKSGRRITFEWALIHNINDTPEEARNLGKLLRGVHCHVNAIRLNPTAGYSGKASDRTRANEFIEILGTYGIPCTVRMRRGIDIQAGCGQLAAREQNPTSG